MSKGFKPPATALNQQAAEKPQPVRQTGMARQTNVTTQAPTTIRLTEYEKAELNRLIDDVQAEFGKKITGSTVIRALLHMRGAIDKQALIESIQKNI